MAEPLKFNHSCNLPFSCRGTGISFEPATAFAHSSNEPVLALGTGIILDQPLTKDFDINSVVRDEKVTTAGYQGTPAPDKWFGGPAFASRAGNIVLRDEAGNVVDGLNYGLIVDPWSAEGYMAVSGAGESGCTAPLPGANAAGGGGMLGAIRPAQIEKSTGRYPDGKDNDSNCRDFLVQNNISLIASATTGSNNIKVASVAGFSSGQKLLLDKGSNTESVVIESVGTAGATITGTATKARETVIPVGNVAGFTVGQTITIGSGANSETAVISTITRAGRRGGAPAPGAAGAAGARPAPVVFNSITVSAPLKKAHPVSAQVSGSGITLSKPLTMAHDIGVQVASNLPTPGKPNQY